MSPSGPVGARANPEDPVQQAVGLVWARLEGLRGYHDADELPRGYSTEWDLLMAAYRLLVAAVDARDAEHRAELAPFSRRSARAP